MKKFSSNLPFIISGVVFLCGGLVLWQWLSSYSSWTLRQQLIIISPLFLEINFMLIAVGAGITFMSSWRNGDMRYVFGKIPRRAWIMLSAICLTGILMLMFAVPRDHRIYYDEDIYENIAQNIAFTKEQGQRYGENWIESVGSGWKRIVGRAAMCNEGKNEYGEFSCERLEYNKEPNGWAYTLSIAFRIFGVHELVAFFTNNFLYLLAILVVFFTSFLLFDDFQAGLYASVIFALTPEVLIWSNTVAVEPSAAFFPALALCALLFFLRTRSNASFFLFTVLLSFSIQFRPEAVMICVVAGLLFVFQGLKEFRKGRFYVFAALFFVLVIPHVAHLYSVKDLGWGNSGPKFSMEYFKNNIIVNSLFYFKNLRYPIVFTILFFFGLFIKNRNTDSFRLPERIVVFIWFLLFWGIFTFFYAGSYNYGADVRFSVLSAIPLSIIAGYGASSVVSWAALRCRNFSAHYVVCAVIVFMFLSFLPFIRAITEEAWAARADHRFARIMAEKLPQDSIVLTHNPNMFLVWGKNAAQASLATEHPSYFNRFFYKYKGGVYFHYNFWCNVPDRLQNSFCKNILKRFNCTPVVSFKERNYKYVLYRVRRKKHALKSGRRHLPAKNMCTDPE